MTFAERAARRQLVAGAALLAAILSAGCFDPVEDRPASWTYIHAAIIQPSCATSGCHSELTATFDIDLDSAEEAYQTLIDQGFVIPGQPDRSRLLSLLRAEEVRKPMPPDQPLPDGDIDLIERWILEGAIDN